VLRFALMHVLLFNVCADLFGKRRLLCVCLVFCVLLLSCGSGKLSVVKVAVLRFLFRFLAVLRVFYLVGVLCVLLLRFLNLLFWFLMLCGVM
jgi:hypothetical protein